MTNETLLDEVLTDYYDSYLETFADVADHKFSLRHRLKMKKIFRLYEKNVRKLKLRFDLQQNEIGKIRFNRKTVMAIVAIVLLSLIAGCAVAYFISENFRGTVHDDNTQLFAINIEGSPTTIEYTYAFSELPQGFELLESDISDYQVYTKYICKDLEEYIVIYQYVKNKYSPHYNTEQKELNNIVIYGRQGVILNMSSDNGERYLIIWDNGDYIIEITSNIDKNLVCDLAKTLNVRKI